MPYCTSVGHYYYSAPLQCIVGYASIRSRPRILYDIVCVQVISVQPETVYVEVLAVLKKVTLKKTEIKEVCFTTIYLCLYVNLFVSVDFSLVCRLLYILSFVGHVPFHILWITVAKITCKIPATL